MGRLKSRKLWAWGAWTILAFGIIGVSLFSESDLPVSDALQWYGAVTMIYLGGQAAIDHKGKP